MSEQYKLPGWIQAVCAVVCLAILLAKELLPRDAWIPGATVAFLLGPALILSYNKRKTGLYLPKSKKSPKGP
jgi:hypothetical protein